MVANRLMGKHGKEYFWIPPSSPQRRAVKTIAICILRDASLALIASLVAKKVK